jgi:hypothetical protein
LTLAADQEQQILLLLPEHRHGLKQMFQPHTGYQIANRKHQRAALGQLELPSDFVPIVYRMERNRIGCAGNHGNMLRRNSVRSHHLPFHELA